jgi:hypothetical protein
MTLREDTIADGQAAWFDTDGLAQTVVYTVKETGEQKQIPVVVAFGDNLGGAGRYLMEEMTAIVRVSDVTLPKDGDAITFDGAEWTVRKIKEGDGLGIAWTIGCTKGCRATQRGP